MSYIYDINNHHNVVLPQMTRSACWCLTLQFTYQYIDKHILLFMNNVENTRIICANT